MEKTNKETNSTYNIDNNINNNNYYYYYYNPPNNFCGLSLDKTDHVVQNRTMVIRRYPPSDLISVV